MTLPRLTALSLLAAAFGIGVWACGPSEPEVLTLATTTSTRDSGLLDMLEPLFEERTGMDLRVVAVGSGAAIEMGRRGDADVLLTHAPDLEEAFLRDGHTEDRRPVMSNDFVILGPPRDPAGIRAAPSAAEAFATVARAQATFVSRGDQSGTHQKEKAIWRAARIQPSGDWYIEAGGGMAQILRMAHEKSAVTLSDRGTWLAQGGDLDLEVLVESDPILRNPYSVMVVSPSAHPDVNVEAATAFADFLLDPDVQQRIGRYGVETFGQPLFHPASR